MLKKAILFFLVFNYCQANFKMEEVNSSFGLRNFQINYFKDNKILSFLRYTKIPLMNRFVIHTVYTYPEFRGCGYARKLLEFTLAILKKEKGQEVYIQPGPFEIVNQETRDICDLNKLEKLVNFYTGLGFKKVNKLVSSLAWGLYKIMGINQDAACLMVKNI